MSRKYFQFFLNSKGTVPEIIWYIITDRIVPNGDPFDEIQR